MSDSTIDPNQLEPAVVPPSLRRLSESGGLRVGGLDAEDLAAYLDGKLSHQERRRLERALAEDDAAFEVFADMLHYRLESRGDADDLSWTQIPRSRPASSPELPALRPTRSRPINLVLAATALLAVTVALMLPWVDRPGELGSGQLLASLPKGETLESALGPQWSSPIWASQTRGAGAFTTTPVGAFQIGVRTVDLAAAIRTGDRATMSQVAAYLDHLLLATPGTIPTQMQLGSLRQRIGSSSEPIAVLERSFDVMEQEQAIEPGSYYEMGRWAAAARLHAIARDQEFFRSNYWQRGLRLLIRYSASAELSQAGQRLGAEPTPEPEKVEAAIDEVIDLLGSGRASLRG